MSPTESSNPLSRREFAELASLALVGAVLPGREDAPPRPQQAFALNETTIAQLQDGMKAGRLSARGVAQAYLGRITALDRQGPTLRAVLEINPEALAIADAMDAERRRGRVRGALHGIPVIVKDNIDTHDRMQTTAGSLALEGNIALRDAFVVDKLRAAGAVILAKANLSEWANFRSTRSSSGWSGRGRQCRNPYVLDRTPSGSSSGSAVAGSRGSTPARTVRSAAASATVRHIGPAVSWLWAMGMIPARLTSPTVGLSPTMPQAFAGLMIDPSVSVPTATTQRLALTATADPELEPDGVRSST